MGSESEYRVTKFKLISSYMNSGYLYDLIDFYSIYNSDMMDSQEYISFFPMGGWMPMYGNGNSSLFLIDAKVHLFAFQNIVECNDVEYYDSNCDENEWSPGIEVSFSMNSFLTGLELSYLETFPSSKESITGLILSGYIGLSRLKANKKSISIQPYDPPQKIVSQCIRGDCNNGQGSYTWGKGPNEGDKYEGEWKDGVFHGIGMYNFRSGDKYEGAWKDGKEDGLGSYIWLSGQKYVGEWKDGKEDGQGIYTLVSGEIKSGIYEDGKFISSRTVIAVESYFREKYTIYVKPKHPPYLTIENLRLDEPSGNSALDGDETGGIRFLLINNGKGFATEIEIKLIPLASDIDLTYNPRLTIKKLDSNSSFPVEIPITAKIGVLSMEREFQIEVLEHFGFDANPVSISFNTTPFRFPELRIEKLVIDDDNIGDSFGNGNSIIEPGESIEVTLFIQNFGDGNAKNVEAEIILDAQKNIYYPDEGESYPIGDIVSKNYKELKFYFNTNRRFGEVDIPLSIKISDSYNKSGEIINLGLKSGELTKNIVRVRTIEIVEDLPDSKMQQIKGLITQEELRAIEREIRAKLEELSNLSILDKSKGDVYTSNSKSVDSAGNPQPKISNNNNELFVEEDEEWKKDKTSCHYRLNAAIDEESNNDNVILLYEECVDEFLERPFQCDQYYDIAKAYKEANEDWESSFNVLNNGYQRALKESECLGNLTNSSYIWEYLISAERVGLDGEVLEILQAKSNEDSEKTLIEYILSKVIEPPQMKLYAYYVYGEINSINIDQKMDSYYLSNRHEKQNIKEEYCEEIRDISYELQNALKIQDETGIESYKENFRQLEKTIKRTERLFSCDN